MKELIRHIIKEETEKSELYRKGIDLAIKLLKKSYPYIVGWNYDKDIPKAYYLYINIICDIEKTKEFFNSELKSYYRKYPEDIKKRSNPYPFSILEISDSMDGDLKYEIYRKFRDELNDIYEMLPEKFIEFDKWGKPKTIDVDNYFFR